MLSSINYKCDFYSDSWMERFRVQIWFRQSSRSLNVYWNYLNLSNLQFELAVSWKPAFHVRFLALTFQVLARNIIFVVLQFQTLMAITIVKIKTLSLLVPGLQKYLVAVWFWKCEKVEEKVFNFLFLFFSFFPWFLLSLLNQFFIISDEMSQQWNDPQFC